MKLQNRLADGEDNHVVRLVDGWYSIEEDGYQRPTPVLHYHGRGMDGEYRHFTIDDFRPYFLVAESDLDDDTADALVADRRVIGIERADRAGVDSGETEVELIKVIVECPWHVRQLRDEFRRTWEGDIRFEQRFLIDQGITSLVKIPTETTALSAEDVTAADVNDVDSPELRVATWDIEVYADDGLPSTKHTRQPITGVALHDSYTDKMTMYALESDADGWDDISVDADLETYESERELLTAVKQWFLEHSVDVLVGWNNDAFDVPYFVNRCLELGLYDIRFADIGGVDEDGIDPNGRFINGDVHGVHVFDLLAAYKKSQYTELKSHGLEDVAAAETDLEKLDVDEQVAWETDPQRFCEYNIRDVAATVAINDEVQLL